MISVFVFAYLFYRSWISFPGKKFWQCPFPQMNFNMAAVIHKPGSSFTFFLTAFSIILKSMKAYIIIFLMCTCTPLVILAQENKVEQGAVSNLNQQGIQDQSAIDQLASDIQKKYKKAGDQLLAIHQWVARNIIYDTDSMYLINWKLSEEKAIEETMRRRRGVCQNYSMIFNALARKCGIESFVVDGFTKQQGRVDKAGHTWVAVKIDDDWALCDPTWDKDNAAALRYFLVSPADFIETHMPFDPLWQLLPYEVSVADFYNGHTGKKQNQPFLNFKDSVAVYSLLDPLQRLEATYRRMKVNAAASQLYKNQVAYVNMKISVLYEEQDLQFYHDAVNDFNEATRLLNQFLVYRNSGFSPAKSYPVLTNDLEAVSKKIIEANIKIKQIGLKMSNDACDPSLLKEHITNLEKRLGQEKLFLQNYFAQNKASQSP